VLAEGAAHQRQSGRCPDQLAQRHADTADFDVAEASLAEGLAWCLARLAAANPLQEQRQQRE